MDFGHFLPSHQKWKVMKASNLPRLSFSFHLDAKCKINNVRIQVLLKEITILSSFLIIIRPPHIINLWNLGMRAVTMLFPLDGWSWLVNLPPSRTVTIDRLAKELKPSQSLTVLERSVYHHSHSPYHTFFHVGEEQWSFVGRQEV